MKSPSGFLWKNPWKKETLLTYYYSAIFRIQLLLLPQKRPLAVVEAREGGV